MNIQIFQIIRHFLYRYLNELQKQNPSKVDSFFKNYFMRDELIALLKWHYSDSLEKHLKVDKCSNKELLSFIPSDTVILEYFLHLWDKEIHKREHPKAKEVWDTLTQLGKTTHYLSRVAVANWDEYDRSNFLSLQRKAGRITQVYGIYQSYVEQEQVYEDIDHPNRFFDSQDLAEQFIQELVEALVLEKEEVHILSLNKAF